jgi:putative SOS response-associated peptidase YedK
MCFNISLKVKKARMEQRYNAVYPEDFDFKPIYHASAFERPKLPLLISQQPDKFQLMKWGLIPSWVKTEKDAFDINSRTMNARTETITQKPSFKQSVKSNRCIIPVSRFFEWQLAESKKIP